VATEREQPPSSPTADQTSLKNGNGYQAPLTHDFKGEIDFVVHRIRDRRGASAVWPVEGGYEFNCPLHAKPCVGGVWMASGRAVFKCGALPDESRATEQMRAWITAEYGVIEKINDALNCEDKGSAALALMQDDGFIQELAESDLATIGVAKQKLAGAGIPKAAVDDAIWNLSPPPDTTVAPPHNDDDVRALQSAEQEQLQFEQMAEDDPRPEIKITTDEHLVNDQAVAAISADKSLFQQHGLGLVLVRKGGGRQRRQPAVEVIPTATLRERMTASARWTKYLKTEARFVASHPPEWSIAAVESRGHWPGIRLLEGVVEHPVIRSDGSVIDQPGYDESTGLFYEPAGNVLPIPAAPTVDDARAAIAELEDLVCDFPFAGPPHRAAWIASLLTPLAAPTALWEWCAPLFFFDANTRGSGKTLLADLVSIVATGRIMSRIILPPDDAEANKLLLAIAIQGDALVFFDEAPTIKGAPLNAALTGRQLGGRVLGETRKAVATLRATFYAAGNNVVVKGDSARRVIQSRLESQDEHPEDREKFKHHNVKAWALQERPRLLRAALTILKAYYVAGRPAQRALLGGFEGWSRAVRDPLLWAGCGDPCETRKEILAADPEQVQLRQLLEGWREVAGAEAITVATAIERQGRSTTLRTVWEEWEAVVGDKVKAVTIGKRMGKFQGRWNSGLRLIKCPMTRGGVVTWRVETQEEASAGVAGVVQGIQKPIPSTFSFEDSND
jgi:hypothetical protein